MLVLELISNRLGLILTINKIRIVTPINFMPTYLFYNFF